MYVFHSLFVRTWYSYITFRFFDFDGMGFVVLNLLHGTLFSTKLSFHNCPKWLQQKTTEKIPKFQIRNDGTLLALQGYLV